MTTHLAIMVNCDRHPARPYRECSRCQDAITINRANPGWGTRIAITRHGRVTWETYQPLRSWFGPDAFYLNPESLTGALP